MSNLRRRRRRSQACCLASGSSASNPDGYFQVSRSKKGEGETGRVLESSIVIPALLIMTMGILQFTIDKDEHDDPDAGN